MRVLKEPIKSRDKVSEYLWTVWGALRKLIYCETLCYKEIQLASAEMAVAA